MVSAIGGIGSGPSGTHSVGTDHELQQLKKKLAECVNCASAATPQGRAEIAEISTRITAIKDHQRTEKAVDGTLGTQLNVYA